MPRRPPVGEEFTSAHLQRSSIADRKPRKEDVLLALFHAFSLKSAQIQQAIRLGDDELVTSLDHDIETLVAAILGYTARSTLEIYMQLQFMVNLVREAPDDRSSVTRNTDALTSLLNRYFAGAKNAAAEAMLSSAPTIEVPQAAPPEPFSQLTSLSDAILDGLEERVAVVTRDYCYLYCNDALARSYSRRPIELVGQHVVDFMGDRIFEARARPKLDSCFSGETVSYKFYQNDDEKNAMRCKMTPMRSETGEILGALVVLRAVSVDAEAVAA
jgi:PAS domain-containing protein